jgi:hypothetical protein
MKNLIKRFQHLVLTMALLVLVVFAPAALTGCTEYQGDGDDVSAPDGGNGSDATNPPESAYLVARACGADCIEFNGLYCDSNTAQLVGDGRAEGINSWYTGKALTKGSNGWFKYILTGASEELHLTLYGCGNNPNVCEGGSTWADYGCPGSPAAPGTHQGGGYMWCGDYLGSGYTCHIALKRDPGKDPVTAGVTPHGP